MKPVRLRRLRADEVEFVLKVVQDDMPVRGNAMASGDDAADKAYEDEILKRLEYGDVWAWSLVTITAKWKGWEVHDTLGACCYLSEEDFKKPGGYFDDMKTVALHELNNLLAINLMNIAELVEEEGSHA